MKRMLLVTCLLSVGLAHRASANAFSMPAAGCVVVPSATTGTLLIDSSGASVGFNAGSTGTIRLVCPVTNSVFATTNSNILSFNVTFNDSDATADNCYITGSLVSWSASTALSGATLATYNGSSDTTLSSSWPYFDWEVNNFSSTAVNFAANYYYASFDLVRTSTTCSISLTGFTIGS